MLWSKAVALVLSFLLASSLGGNTTFSQTPSHGQRIKHHRTNLRRPRTCISTFDCPRHEICKPIRSRAIESICVPDTPGALMSSRLSVLLKNKKEKKDKAVLKVCHEQKDCGRFFYCVKFTMTGVCVHEERIPLQDCYNNAHDCLPDQVCADFRPYLDTQLCVTPANELPKVN